MILDTGLIERRVWYALELLQSQTLASAVLYEWEAGLLGICFLQEEDLFLRLDESKSHYRWLPNLIHYHTQFVNGDIAVNILPGDRFKNLIHQFQPCCRVLL